MSLFGRSMLEEGYYIEDEYGDFTRLEESDMNMFSCRYRNELYYHDGYSLDKVNDSEEEIEP